MFPFSSNLFSCLCQNAVTAAVTDAVCIHMTELWMCNWGEGLLGFTAEMMHDAKTLSFYEQGSEHRRETQWWMITETFNPTTIEQDRQTLCLLRKPISASKLKKNTKF